MFGLCSYIFVQITRFFKKDKSRNCCVRSGMGQTVDRVGAVSARARALGSPGLTERRPDYRAQRFDEATSLLNELECVQVVS